jgi:predicted XRE-type DNA-binding protein
MKSQKIQAEKEKKRSRFTFPPEEELKKLLKRVEQPNYRRVNIGLRPNATPTEKAKYKLCKDILRHKQENQLKTEDIAQHLGISIAEAEYILFSHINQFRLDELIKYADNLHLPFKLTINGSYAEKESTAEAH